MSSAGAAVNERRRGPSGTGWDWSGLNTAVRASLDCSVLEHGRGFQRQTLPEPPLLTVIAVGRALTFSSLFARGRTFHRPRPGHTWATGEGRWTTASAIRRRGRAPTDSFLRLTVSKTAVKILFCNVLSRPSTATPPPTPGRTNRTRVSARWAILSMERRRWRVAVSWRGDRLVLILAMSRPPDVAHSGSTSRTERRAETLVARWNCCTGWTANHERVGFRLMMTNVHHIRALGHVQ